MKNLSTYKTTQSKLLIKTLLLIAIASVVSVGAYAQAQLPIKWTSDNSIHTLNCTEDAVTLKLSVKAGWHINSLHVGNMAPVNSTFELPPLNQYSTKGPVAASASSIRYKTTADTGLYSGSDTTLNPITILRAPKATNVLDKLNHIHWANKIPANTSNEFIILTSNKPLIF